jgi:hypothetical protein
LLVDEGFKVGQALLDLQTPRVVEGLLRDGVLARNKPGENALDVAKNREKYGLIADLSGMVAHTEGDIIKGQKSIAKAERAAIEQSMPLPKLPRTVNMAQSPAKKLEGFSIAHDSWFSTNYVLDQMHQPQAIATRPKEALIMGYGAVAGKGQPQLQSGYHLWIWDIDPAALLRAHQDHAAQVASGQVHIPVSKSVLEGVMARGGHRNDPEFVAALSQAKPQWLAHGHMVVGNTGAPGGSLSPAELAALPDGAILTSAGSGNYEFGTPASRQAQPQHLRAVAPTHGKVDFALGGAGTRPVKVPVGLGDQAYYNHQVYETHNAAGQAKRLMILRGGYAINRLYGMPSQFSDITRSIMLRSMHEALKPHNDTRPKSGLWLVDADAKVQRQLIDAVNGNLAKQGLGHLEEPNFTNIAHDWHWPSVAQPHFRRIKREPPSTYTPERFVQSGFNAFQAHNLSPAGFALIADAPRMKANARNIDILQAELLNDASLNTQPQRTLAHVLYGVYAQNSRLPSGVDAKVNAARQKLGIDDAQWQQWLSMPDAFGLKPSDYASLVGGDAPNQQAKQSMQQAIASVSINPPSFARLRGDAGRKNQIMNSLNS